MAYRILSVAILACLAGLAAAPASAQSTYESRCSRDKWSGVYRCWADYSSPYSSSSTYCTSGRDGVRCDTSSGPKWQPPAHVRQDCRHVGLAQC